MDTTLAGIGTEKQFCNPDCDDSVHGISLTPDQGNNPWISSLGQPSSQDFEMEVDQADPTLFSRHSSKVSVSGYSQSGQDQAGPFATEALDRTNSSKLDALAALASSQKSPGKASRQAPHVSKEPQTKAEQQKHALRKFSKIIQHDIQNASNNEPIDLQNVIQRTLHGATRWSKHRHPSYSQQSGDQATSPVNPSGHAPANEFEVSMTKTEISQAYQAMQNIIKQMKRPMGATDRSRAFSSNMKTCGECGVVLARSCDMRYDITFSSSCQDTESSTENT